MRPTKLVKGAALAAAAGAIFVAGAALADRADDRATAEARLTETERGPGGELAREMTVKARAALERATKLRARGDEPNARLADGLALAWANAARDAVRAAEAELRASRERHAANDAGALSDRERALLEEGLAQAGRVRAQLEGLARQASEQPARTSAASEVARDGGAPGTPRPKAPTTRRDGGAS